MSFSEDCVRFGGQLAKFVDAGVAVGEAAARLGISRQRGYAILRATGRPIGSPRPDRRGVDTGRIVAVFDASPAKQGRFLPGSHLPILSPDAVHEVRPDDLLILPWNLKDEIMGQLAFIGDWGGRFVTASPETKVLP